MRVSGERHSVLFLRRGRFSPLFLVIERADVLKNNLQAPIVAAERRKCSPGEYLVVKAHIAHT